MAAQPSLEFTPLSQILPAYEKVTETFRAGTTRSIEWRKGQLKQLGLLLQENEQAITDAVQADLGRPAFETITGEIEPTKGEIAEAMRNLKSWAAPRKVSTSLAWYFAKATIYPVPKGVALIIGTWNFLLFGPFIGAIAAGCTAILKPAEQNPAVSTLFTSLIAKYLDPAAYVVVNGAVDETTALLSHRYDHIFYTGSGRVGRIVAKAAAEHLTPVTLELGGKSPACIFDDANVTTIGRRLLWGKWSNSGQICMSPDYVLCTAEMQPKVIESFKAAIAEFSPEGSLLKNPDFSSIINSTQFERLSKLIDETKGRIVIGGERDEATRKIEITVVADVLPDDVLMKSEIFGPVLPILVVEDAKAMVDLIRSRDNPLSLYVFTQSTANRDYIFENTQSGQFVQNDVLVQFLIQGLPFGGAGPSGYGQYHGKHSFDTFSHERSSASVPTWMEMLLAARYPPYTPSKLKTMFMATGTTIKR
ncbi:hypothetical protein RQP46_006393 [Phenoliferia psychrophenolica]